VRHTFYVQYTFNISLAVSQIIKQKRSCEYILNLTNSVELSPSWEAASHSAIPEFCNILWNLEVHYHVRKSCHWFLFGTSSIPPPNPTSVRSFLILTTSLHLGLPMVTLLLAFPLKSYINSSSHVYYMPCPSHPSWLDHSNYTWQRVQVMKLLIMQFSPASLFSPNILLSTLNLLFKIHPWLP
jgi:hypothetical protein